MPTPTLPEIAALLLAMLLLGQRRVSAPAPAVGRPDRRVEDWLARRRGSAFGTGVHQHLLRTDGHPRDRPSADLSRVCRTRTSYDKPVLTLPTLSGCRRFSLGPDQCLGRGRRCVTRVFLKPSVLVDLHVAVQAVLMAGPVRCALRRMSVSRHTSPLEPASGHDVSACHRRAAGASAARRPRTDRPRAGSDLDAHVSTVMASPGHHRRRRGQSP